MTEPLSTAVKSATAAAHTSAEDSDFMSTLLEGQACPGAFIDLTAQLRVIYEALEDAVRRFADDPIVAPLYDPRLERVERLDDDLQRLAGDDWAEQLADGRLPVHPATRRYVEVLTAAPDAETVAANHYVRYLGDLSGGQIIARLVARQYGIPTTALSFYDFPGIEKMKQYKDDYRRTLDELPLSPESRELFLQRAVEAFQLNEAVFADLLGSREQRHAEMLPA